MENVLTKEYQLWGLIPIKDTIFLIVLLICLILMKYCLNPKQSFRTIILRIQSKDPEKERTSIKAYLKMDIGVFGKKRILLRLTEKRRYLRYMEHWYRQKLDFL